MNSKFYKIYKIGGIYALTINVICEYLFRKFMKKKNWTVDGHSAKSVLSLFQPKNSCMNTIQNYIMEANPSVRARTNRSNFKQDQEKDHSKHGSG